MSEQQKSSWWRHAVIYQIYPRSWADADGSGVGDLPGITARFAHLADLGVDAVWLSPFYTSPQHDAGYDVADYRDVDPLFGNLDDAAAMVERAHELGLRIIVDIVPNHTSSDHVWFQAALASPPGSPERARYLFREGKGADGSEPPNNWVSNFGGPAWTRVTEADGSLGQWYLHLFDTSQPDLDWTNPEVGDEMERTLRFWLDRGVDGFRIDVAHGLVKEAGLPDVPPGVDFHTSVTHLMPMWDQDGVHDIYRRWRQVTDSYADPVRDADRILCGEAWVNPADRLARYIRPDELHQTFNFDFLMTPWLADELHTTISDSLAAADAVGAPQTWVLSNHDVVRHASRLGYPQEPGKLNRSGIGIGDPQPDAELGLRRARAATTMMLALPGSAYLYQGEELGLPEATELPDDIRQDPTWAKSGHTERGRDGCRVPIPWEADAPAYGFNTSGKSWLPQPASYGELALDRQQGKDNSTYELYKGLLATRHEQALGEGRLSWRDDLGEHVLAFDITTPGGRIVTAIANLGSDPVKLPEGVEVLVSSAPLDPARVLATDVAAWVS